jgi:hypothetical protein
MGGIAVSDSIQSNPWRFCTRLKEPHVVVVSKDFRDADGDFHIDWTAELEVRSWGIKSITPVVHSVTGVLSASDSTELPTEFLATSDSFAIETTFTLAPKTVTIDLDAKTIWID